MFQRFAQLYKLRLRRLSVQRPQPPSVSFYIDIDYCRRVENRDPRVIDKQKRAINFDSAEIKRHLSACISARLRFRYISVFAARCYA